MNYPTEFYDFDFDSEETGLIREEVGAASLETLFYNPTLFLICIPIIIFGVIANVLILWMWLRVKTVDDMVYLFRALAVADFLYLANYLFARFYFFHNVHIRTFFRILSFGNRAISIQITLMLAIARFIRIFFPLHVQKMLSHSRLRSWVMLIIFCNLSLHTLLTGAKFYLPEKYYRYGFTVIKKGIMLSAPTLAQNVLMLMVVLKLRQFSKTVASSCDPNVLPLTKKEQTMPEHENQEQPAHTSETSTTLQTGCLLALKHSETVCDAGPQDPRTPVHTEHTVHPGQTAEEGLPNTNQGSVVYEAELGMEQQRDPLSKSEPQNATQGHSVCIQESGPGNDRIPLHLCTSSKRQTDIDHRLIYVVLAMCVCTFVEGTFCSVVKILVYHLKIYEAPYWSSICNVLILINHSINLVFYLFIHSFRHTLLAKCSRLVNSVKTFTSISLKATYPVMSSGRTALDSNREIQTPSKPE